MKLHFLSDYFNTVFDRITPVGVAHPVTCLTADACLTANQWVESSISVRSNDHGIISTVILFLSAESRRVVLIYKRKFVPEVLVNRLTKLAKEKSVDR